MTDTVPHRPSVMTTYVPSGEDPKHYALTVHIPVVLASHDGAIRYNVTAAYRCGFYNVLAVANQAGEHLASLLNGDAYPWDESEGT